MKPAASTICYESIILWSNNKTSEWLSSLDQESKNEILDRLFWEQTLPVAQVQKKDQHIFRKEVGR
jgi:hypothetical protein